MDTSDAGLVTASDAEEAAAAAAAAVAAKRRSKGAAKRPLPEVSDSEGGQSGGSEARKSRKKFCSAVEAMSDEQEREMVDFFGSHPEYYDQSLQSFKQRAKKEALLDELGERIGTTGEFSSFLIYDYYFNFCFQGISRRQAENEKCN